MPFTNERCVHYQTRLVQQIKSSQKIILKSQSQLNSFRFATKTNPVLDCLNNQAFGERLSCKLRGKYAGLLHSSKRTSTRPMDCSRDWKVLSKSSEPAKASQVSWMLQESTRKWIDWDQHHPTRPHYFLFRGFNAGLGWWSFGIESHPTGVTFGCNYCRKPRTSSYIYNEHLSQQQFVVHVVNKNWTMCIEPLSILAYSKSPKNLSTAGVSGYKFFEWIMIALWLIWLCA